ncbi:MAG: hypothetical protein ACKVS6_00700 [Planctomycetota bacterium]
MRSKPKSFSQASVRRHTRHGRHYDPTQKNDGPLLYLAFGFGALVLLVAGGFAVWKFTQLSEQERIERERPENSRKLLQEVRDYQRMHSSDAEIPAVRAFVNSKIEEMMVNEKQQAYNLLAGLTEQERQGNKRRKIDQLLSDVRTGMNDPNRVDEVSAKSVELENMLGDIEDNRVEDVKKDIFNARGKTAVLKARAGVAKIEKQYEKDDRDLNAVLDAYQKVDEELMSSAVAQRFPEAQEIHSEIGLKMSDLAERWAESGRGFNSILPRDLLNPKEFQPKAGDTKAPWDASPSAKLTFAGGKLIIEGVKATGPALPDERAGIAYWGPSQTEAMHHYELRMRVKIIKKGFFLLARKSTGYLQHTYEFESNETGKPAGEDAFFPVEGATYDIVEKVVGKKVNISVTPLNPDEPLPIAIESTTNARWGGIGIRVREGAKIEIDKMEVRILN